MPRPAAGPPHFDLSGSEAGKLIGDGHRNLQRVGDLLRFKGELGWHRVVAQMDEVGRRWPSFVSRSVLQPDSHGVVSRNRNRQGELTVRWCTLRLVFTGATGPARLPMTSR